MPLTTFGYESELLYRVREEVLGTRFYWQIASGANYDTAVPRLAEAVAGQLTGLSDAFGTDFKWDCIKTKALGFETLGWSYELAVYVGGTGASIAIDELCHANISIQSEFDNDTQKRITNRNQMAGLPQTDVTDGAVSEDFATTWFNELETWAQGIQAGGFTFLLACGRYQAARWEFLPAERFKVGAYVGTRIDRVKNRPNTGRKPPEPENGGEPVAA